MNSGFVYILINESMPNVIKIGKTKRDSKLRARELSNTSVPTPFKVAFEIFSDDMDQLEKKVHDELNDFRVSNNREFFRYPLYEAITLVQNLNNPPEDKDSWYKAISIYSELYGKYSIYLKETIVDVRIVQTEDIVWIEITNVKFIGDDLMDMIIHRSDLGFISDGCFDEEKEDGGMYYFFDPKDDISLNVQKFINEYDAYSIVNTLELFNDEACEKIVNEYHSKSL